MLLINDFQEVKNEEQVDLELSDNSKLNDFVYFVNNFKFNSLKLKLNSFSDNELRTIFDAIMNKECSLLDLSNNSFTEIQRVFIYITRLEFAIISNYNFNNCELTDGDFMIILSLFHASTFFRYIVVINATGNNLSSINDNDKQGRLTDDTIINI